MDIKELEQVIRILKENNITEFELVEKGIQIKLSRAELAAASVVASAAAAPGVAPAPPAPSAPAVQPQQQEVQVVPSPAAAAPQPGAPAASVEDANLTRVESPLVGTFYRKPSPDDPNFVNEGDVVKKGDTLCIVEAMKLMNEIEAPSDGKIVKIALTDGQVAEFGELLFLIDPRV